MKVILIGYCSNAAVREKITWGRKGAGDVAFWNTLLIEGLRKRGDIELHWIAPAYHMKHLTQEFEIDGVNYHFFKPDVPFLNISWKHLFHIDNRTNYWLTRRIVHRWIRKINPDIVNLIGAENPDYSASILGLKGYPVFVTLQSVYSNPERFKVEKEDCRRSRIERKVFAENIYFGANAPQEPVLVRRDSPNAYFLWNRFPQLPRDVESECSLRREHRGKKYDFVQFSGMTELKGVPDTIRATAVVKQKFPNVSVRMYGGWRSGYLNKMRALVKELGLDGNVIISDGYRTHAEVMSEALKAKSYILPTKIDTLPTTIFEAVKLGLPVISYMTGDIPKLNVGDERVLLARQGDIEGLAKRMMRLMGDDDFARELNAKCRMFVNKYFSNEANVNGFWDNYKAVIENYRNGTPIPDGLFYENYLERRINNDI